MLIGYCLCGSFCTLKKSLTAMRELVALGHSLIPIVSSNVYSLDTRFYLAKDLLEEIHTICSRPAISDIVSAEPLGPKVKCDVMVVCPCTSNTLAKLRYGITDTPVTMAVKAHIRNERPVVIALCTNDGLGACSANLGAMLIRKNYYFTPLYQDDYNSKPRSLVSDISKLTTTIELAMQGKQYQPMITFKDDIH